MATTPFHVAMFPWFAVGHITPFLNISNMLAEKGHRVSFFIPTNAQDKFNHLNLYPHLIQFIPLTIPHVDGLPPGVETAWDVAVVKLPLLGKAFDLTQDQVEIALHHLKPHLIFFDFASWIPALAHPLGIKSIFYFGVGAASCAVVFGAHTRMFEKELESTGLGLIDSPPRPPTHSHITPEEKDEMILLFHRHMTALSESEAICLRACSEIEGPYVDYVAKQYSKQVLLLGPNLPKPLGTPLEERWHKWLGGFEKGSVVYCAFGSECVLSKEQFQELVLGLELSGFPFLARLKPPIGAETVEEVLPQGFHERVNGRGVVHGDWLQQQHILSHPSVGCFVSHCGASSMWESLVSSCQMVSIPHLGDQYVNSKLMTSELKVAVDVERREEDGWFGRESVCKAVKLVMDQGSEVGEEVRANHRKWKEFLLTEGLQASYTNNFISKLQDILK